ncbi:hypothetical protein [Paraburkholderia tropica]|uniref:hypothetical protein n=1 Tax=Paraburkholderia tropica TaxID=92647 RepID=UPI002AB79633|nr:hypothetical protein [Paraburkholderia tropica]
MRKMKTCASADLNLLASALPGRNVDEDTELLLKILALDQCDIDAGGYRDVDVFFDELESDSPCGDETSTTAKKGRKS